MYCSAATERNTPSVGLPAFSNVKILILGSNLFLGLSKAQALRVKLRQ